MSYLLDTSVLIEIENDVKAVIDTIRALPEGNFYISIFTFCEYYRGFVKKSDAVKAKVIEELNKYILLDTSKKTGICFVELLETLSKKGEVLPHFDVFIAAFAKTHHLTLITRDNHFKRLEKEINVILV